jgi:hypothetical protein
MKRKPAPQQSARNADHQRASNFNLSHLDARLLDESINERGWTLDEADYIGRIQSGQTLNGGLRRTANSY